ncbi:DUF421 domain-containing protein [Calorimonas adulescens]|jgi:Protein of unknown function (DUF421).|uniref:DUF421 domain-containing protein n=1 Tax=Calorimonas adulescens TaxID=2606906 RepID=A0A5D8QBU8_9THEO|nr:DUF421 domain-containing protein [Calorimonas adulescens]TZE81003.1 DUF421 domain-containing protein [Calorimonas adulescens]
MLVIFTRALILYFLVVIVMRIMGKQQIGELQPYELVVAVMIADLGAVPMQNTGIPLLAGIIPILTLLISQLALSYISMKSIRGRELICGTPTILIEKGRLLEAQMRKERYNINDLLEALRNQGYYNIADVEYAILETNGTLSVIPKVEKRPVTPQDLNLNPPYEGLPLPVVIDGTVDFKTLKAANKDFAWLKGQLKAFGISDVSEVLLASIDSSGNLFVQAKEVIK